MVIRELTRKDKDRYNKLIYHPLQSWEWGEFREKMGVEVVRVGFFEKNKLVSGYQLTFHRIPLTPYCVGYVPKGDHPRDELIESLRKIGKKYNVIFIKLEPNIVHGSQFVVHSSLRRSPKPLFTKYTFHIDLTKSKEELLKKMSSKTRYNVRLAQKKGVTVQEENTQEAFKKYLELTQETTKRQSFYAHSQEYHQKMWETLRPSGIVHLLTARYQGKILVTWIVFLFNNVLYYPYGASSHEHKELMASNLMMWEAMRWGKAHDATVFDLWGTPGPNPKPTDPYYGFHKFKLGYNPKLVEFIGSYDLVLKQPHYLLFQLLDKVRWHVLRLKAKL